MPPISRGFRGRPREDVDPSRVPPGQYVVTDFPVLSAGPTPRTPLDEWSFTISGAVGEPVSWPWEEFLALPSETLTADIHCVTKWSKLDTMWTGVSLDTLLDGVATEGRFGHDVDRRVPRHPARRGRNRGPLRHSVVRRRVHDQ